jgi:hypothetical protein|tara:strand:- start:29 stop:259 length:231 start_codon:yes stop_codon:yes gene_type:complete
MKESSWDAYRRREAIAKAGGNYRAWEGGKGDIDRSTHTTKYQLGSELIRLAESHGKDSKEYQECLAQWRKAIKENR